MSHRKIHSQGNIPFSWEDSPGISKAIHQDFPLDKGLHAFDLSSSPPTSPTPFPRNLGSSFLKVSAQDTKIIPLPPCQKLQLPRRSTSAKGLGWWQNDPFLAAYKECTKNQRNGNLPRENNKKNVFGHKVKKSKLLIFSCKNSCDVKDDNLVNLCSLPPIRRDRMRGR